MQTSGRWLGYLFSLLVLTASSACSDRAQTAGRGEPDLGMLGTQVAELSGGETHERCDTLPADLVWTGGGFVRTGTNYTAHNGTNECWDAFLIDVNSYHAKYVDGTRVTYGRVVPRDEATCRRTVVRGHFWRKNSNGTTTYLGGASERGRWITGSNLPPRCEVASFVIERDVPGYVPGASYRLAVTARQDRATSGYDRREIVVATQMPDFAMSTAKVNSRVNALRNRLISDAVDPAVARYFARRGSTVAAINCRVAQLELSAMRISELSLIQAGGNETEVRRAVDAYANLLQAYCGTGALTALQFQNLLRTYLLDFHNMKKTMWVTHGTSAAEEAVLVASLFATDLARIMAGCGTELVEVLGFVRTGAVPTGIVGPNVLLRNCSGGASSVQNRLGMGGPAAPIRASFRSCIVEAFDEAPSEQQAGVCSDPRANGGGGAECPGGCHDAADPCFNDPVSDACLRQREEDTGLDLLTDPEVKAETIEEWLLQNAYSEANDNYTHTSEEMNQHLLSSAEHRARARNWEEASDWGSVANDVAEGMENPEDPSYIDEVFSGISKATKLVSRRLYSEADAEAAEAERLRQKLPELEAERQRRQEELCKKVPDHDSCNKPATPPADPAERCPEIDIGNGSVWLARPDGQQLTVADRIQSCTCEAMRRGTFPLSGGGTSDLVCMTAAERRAFDCQTNPWDDDDGPLNPLLRPECRNAFQPSGADRDALLVGLCNATRCAEDQVSVAAFGRCVCLDQPTTGDLADVCDFNGPAGRLDCGPTGGSLVCDEMGPRCVDQSAGRTPFGNNPFCRLRGQTAQLGARPAWGEATSSSFFTALTRVQSTTRQAFMMRQGFQMLGGPATFERSFDQVGSDIMIDVVQPSALPADRGSVQGYCSNPEAGVHNVFLGQRELTAGLNTARFGFDQRCWGDGTTPMHVGVSVRTATNQVDRAAFLGFRFGGTMRAVEEPVETCDDGPDPIPPRLDPSILVDILSGNIRPGIIAGTWTRDVAFGGSSLDARLIPVDRTVFLR